MPDTTPASAQERELYSRLRQILTTHGLLRGNLVEMHRACGRKNCRCHEAPRFRHRSLYLGLSLNGKHRMIYVPVAWEPTIREWVDRYHEARDLLEQISCECLDRLQRRSD